LAIPDFAYSPRLLIRRASIPLRRPSHTPNYCGKDGVPEGTTPLQPAPGELYRDRPAGRSLLFQGKFRIRGWPDGFLNAGGPMYPQFARKMSVCWGVAAATPSSPREHREDPWAMTRKKSKVPWHVIADNHLKIFKIYFKMAKPKHTEP